jgi:hypothetical protein
MGFSGRRAPHLGRELSIAFSGANTVIAMVFDYVAHDSGMLFLKTRDPFDKADIWRYQSRVKG